MCLSDLARVVDHDPSTYNALVDIDGRQRNVSTITLGLDGPRLSPGDWLVVHTGMAVERLSTCDAAAILRARAELARAPSWRKEQP
jgi:hydrogenase assembly chaperone HypC/HupF